MKFDNFTVHLVIHPSTHSTGSDAHPYQTMTVDRSQFTGPLELDKSIKQSRIEDWNRSQGKDWAYLLGDNSPGRLFCKSRGKLVFLAAGQVHNALLFIIF